MSKENWLLYGAYGYTGQLIAKEAVSRGHKPILAGRSAEKLIPLANNLNLDYRVFDLTDNNLQQILAEFNLVYHAAGPYIHTSAPMVQACLKAGTNYLDLTGEIPVLEHNFKLDEQARQRQIAIISGAGFDVIPTDCLAKSVSELISNPTHLEIAIALCTETECVSPGTMKTVMEHISPDALIRKDGTLIKLPMGSGAKEIRFSDKTRKLVPSVWADLVTAYVSTGIPNITVYAPYSKSIVKMMKETKLKKDKVHEWIKENVSGPDEQMRNTAHSYITAKVINNKGEEAQAWLETMEAYRFTAVAGVRAVEKIFEFSPKGVLTPSLAFGEDFILDIPETKRFDSL